MCEGKKMLQKHNVQSAEQKWHWISQRNRRDQGAKYKALNRTYTL